MRSTWTLSGLDLAAIVLVIIGGLNWGFIGLSHFLANGTTWNLVSYIFGGTAAVEFSIYVIVGLAGVWTMYVVARGTGYVPRERPVEREAEADPQD